MRAPEPHRPDRFVGRELELAQLEAAIEDALAGRGRLILLSGEPGIGKTRLAEECASRASARSVLVVWGRCWEGAGAPALWPWIQVIRSLLAGKEQHVRQPPTPPEIAHFVAELGAQPGDSYSGSGSQYTRFRLFDTIANFLKRFTQISPVLIVLDDLHDADHSSLDLLKFVASGIADSRIMMVCTHRDAEVRRSEYLSEAIGNVVRHGAALPLAGLGETEVTQMVAARAERELSQGFAVELCRVTGGNPLFVDGVLRVLIAERKLGDSDHIDLRGFQLPEGVRGTIGKRLSLLSADARHVLAIGAVLGQEFDLELVRQVSDLSLAAIVELTDEAAEVGLVLRVAHERHRFTHPLIREVLYKNLSDTRRIELHRLAGQALEQIHSATASAESDQIKRASHERALPLTIDYAAAAHRIPHGIESLSPADLNQPLAELAHHFRQGHVSERAAYFSYLAGLAAEKVSGFEEAIAQYEAGLKWADRKRQPLIRAQTLLRCGVVRMLTTTDQTTGIAHMEQALDLFDQLGEREDVARSHAEFGVQLSKDDHETRTDIPRAMVHFARSQELLGATPQTDSILLLQLGLSFAAWKSLDIAGGLEATERGLAAAGEEKDRVLAEGQALNYRMMRSYVLQYGGRISEALALVPLTTQPLAEFTGRDYVGTFGRLAKNWGELRRNLWDPDEGVKWLSKGFEVGNRVERSPWIQHAVTEHLGIAQVMAGDLNKARELAHDVRSTLLSGLISLHLGDWAEAHDLFAKSLAIATASGSRVRAADATFWSARAYRVAAEHARARAVLERGLRTFGDGSLPLVEMWLRPELALVLVEEGNGDEAEGQLARCREILSGGEDWRGLVGHVARAEGVLAATRGMLREADAHFTRTGEIFDRFRLPWEEAETLLLWGLALNVTGDARASEKFDAAIMVYRRHGAGDRWLEHARSLRKPARRRATGRSAEPVLEVQSTFRKEGDFWTVTHDGRAFRLRDMKGLAYIAHLIAHPGVRIHARDLVAIVEGPAPDGATTSIGRAYADGLGAASDLGDAGEALDAQAVSSYRRRLLEVRAELAEAENNNDLGATERARHELEALSNQLAGGVGRRGRVRRSSSHVERARAAVTKNIRAGVERIRRNDAKLGEHFAASIRTGAFCAYLPDLKNNLPWQT